MKSINFYPSILTPEETNSISKQVLMSLTDRNRIDENLEIAYTELSLENSMLTKKLNTSRSNPFSKLFSDYIIKRDSIFKGGKYNVKSYLYWIFENNKREAAEKIYEVFKKHENNLQNFSYQEQSSIMNSFIKELGKPEMQAYIATLNLIFWYRELVKSQDQVEDTYNKKAAFKNGKESLAKKDAQIPVNNKLENLFTYLNATIIFKSQVPEWVEIIKDIESIVTEMSTNARIRRNLHNNK